MLALVGVLPEEQAADQPLEVDLDVEVDLRAAGASDELADTVDYGAVLRRGRRAARAGPSHVDLLERLAARIAEEVLGLTPASRRSTVAVRKLRPPVPHDLPPPACASSAGASGRP